MDFKVDFKQNVCYMFLCHESMLPSKKIILLYYTSLSVIVLKYFIKQTSNESQFRNFIRSVGCQNAWPRNAVAFKNLLPATFKILITESDSTKPIFFRVDTQDVWSPVRHTFDPPHLMSNKFRHDVEIILIFILNSILNGINM